MANYNQAPVLKFDIPKDRKGNYYELPQKLIDEVFKKLGNSSAQLKIMIVLIGTKPGFAISEQWILNRTGLSHTSYINARKSLIELGWITLDKNKSLTVNFQAIADTK